MFSNCINQQIFLSHRGSHGLSVPVVCLCAVFASGPSVAKMQCRSGLQLCSGGSGAYSLQHMLIRLSKLNGMPMGIPTGPSFPVSIRYVLLNPGYDVPVFISAPATVMKEGLQVVPEVGFLLKINAVLRFPDHQETAGRHPGSGVEGIKLVMFFVVFHIAVIGRADGTFVNN